MADGLVSNGTPLEIISDFLGRAVMARQSEIITRVLLQRILKTPTKTDYEVADSRLKGLVVRVRKTTATWALRGRLGPKQSIWRIEDIEKLTDPNIILLRAGTAKEMLKRGEDPTDYLREQEHQGKPVRTFDKEKDGWTWTEAVTEFLIHIKLNRSPHTHTDYRNALNCPDIQGSAWGEKLLKHIKASDIRLLKEKIGKRGAVAQSNHVLRVVKSLLSWATQQEGSGITDTPSVALVVKPTEHRAKLGRVPTPQELGLIPWRLDEFAKQASGRLAVMLTMLTVQRRETIVSARQADFVAFDGNEGWGMWRMEPDAQIANDRPHAVPLPPLTWKIVLSAKQLAGKSEWLFPQLRLYRKDDQHDQHMSATVIRDGLNACKLDISPHDLRRALATHGPALLAIPDRHTKLILNHAEGRVGDVTTRHYAFHESIPDKVAVMERWENWLIQQMSQHRPAGNEWPTFLPKME
jgi:integrase